MRIYHEGTELPRSAGLASSRLTRIRGTCNGRFDNSLVTRWRSWQALSPDMFIEIDFGEPSIIDTIVLESSGDQWDIKLKLEGLDPSGDWRTISETPIDTQVEASPALRRAASTGNQVCRSSLSSDSRKTSSGT